MVSSGRRLFLAYVATALSVSAVEAREEDLEPGAVEALGLDEAGPVDPDPSPVSLDHPAIRGSSAYRSAVRMAHERRREGDEVRVRLEVDDPVEYRAAELVFLELPSSCRSTRVRGAYVKYEGVVYLVRPVADVL